MKFSITKTTISFLEMVVLSYSLRGFKNSEKWAKFILNNIEKRDVSDYKKDFQELEIALSQDINKAGRYFAKTWSQIKGIYMDAIQKKIRPLLETVFPYANEYLRTIQNLEIILKMADEGKLSSREKYYFNCFIYLIVIEGCYKNWIKILYYLFYQTNKGNINLEQINKDNLPNLINSLTNWGVENTLFECYENGHLRNAIAHAHFSFDEKSKKMKFKNWDKNILKWENEYTLEEFIKFRDKATIFTDLCLDMIYLLRIYDICYVNITE